MASASASSSSPRGALGLPPRAPRSDAALVRKVKELELQLKEQAADMERLDAWVSSKITALDSSVTELLLMFEDVRAAEISRPE